MIHQIAKKWTIVPFSKFYGKISVGFCLNTEKRFVFILKRFHFKTNRKNIGSSKKRY